MQEHFAAIMHSACKNVGQLEYSSTTAVFSPNKDKKTSIPLIYCVIENQLLELYPPLVH
jgi:hypothetical protein